MGRFLCVLDLTREDRQFCTTAFEISELLLSELLERKLEVAEAGLRILAGKLEAKS